MPPPRRQTHAEKADQLLEERGLPFSEASERLVLGAILSNNRLHEQATALITADSYHLEAHRRMWVCIGLILDRGDTADMVTLADELQKHKQLESVGGLAALVDLGKGLPDLTDITSHVRLIREKADLRDIIRDAEIRMDQALSGIGTAQEIAAAGIERLQSLQRSKDGDEGKTPEQVVEEFPGGINAFLDPSQRATGLQTGFKKFDEYTAGLHPGELTIIGARPAMGKSALALNIATNLAMHPTNPVPVSVFSLEMMASSLITRIMCGVARVDAHKFRTGYLNADERRRLQQALWGIIKSPLRIYDKFGITMPELEHCLRRDVKKHGCKLGIVDYLQLIGVKKKGENRNLDLSEMTRRMKVMIGPSECNIPLIVLSQLSRANEKRTGGDIRPRLSDLRESGALEQDADSVHFIHREEVYKRDRMDLQGVAEIIIGKQRNGPVGICKMRFIGEYTKFENAAEDAPEEY